MDADSYKGEIRKVTRPEDRVACFGALLTAETGEPVEIVGGSAIEIYLGSVIYATNDVELVAKRTIVEGALHRWGFRRTVGRRQRVYWTDGYVGLVDLVGSIDRSGLPPIEFSTSYGPVLLSAREPLIARRLMQSHRDGAPELLDQAAALARLGALDWDYLRSEARSEEFVEELAKLRELAPPSEEALRRRPAKRPNR